MIGRNGHDVIRSDLWSWLPLMSFLNCVLKLVISNEANKSIHTQIKK